jgi:hypothetical protein
VDDQEVIMTRLISKVVEIELVTECLVDGKVKSLILGPTGKALVLFREEDLSIGLLDNLVLNFFLMGEVVQCLLELDDERVNPVDSRT